MLIGVVVFLIGWIYAITEFGFFLGVGLGWLPALVIAYLSALLVEIFFASVATAQDDTLIRKYLSNLGLRFVPKWVAAVVFSVGVLCASAFFGYAFFKSEFDGSCAFIRSARTELEDVENALMKMGVDDLEFFRRANFGMLVQRYGSDLARKSPMLRDADVKVAKAEIRAKNCF